MKCLLVILPISQISFVEKMTWKSGKSVNVEILISRGDRNEPRAVRGTNNKYTSCSIHPAVPIIMLQDISQLYRSTIHMYKITRWVGNSRPFDYTIFGTECFYMFTITIYGIINRSWITQLKPKNSFFAALLLVIRFSVTRLLV